MKSSTYFRDKLIELDLKLAAGISDDSLTSELLQRLAKTVAELLEENRLLREMVGELNDTVC